MVAELHIITTKNGDREEHLIGFIGLHISEIANFLKEQGFSIIWLGGDMFEFWDEKTKVLGECYGYIDNGDIPILLNANKRLFNAIFSSLISLE